jgi:formate hydrogenlyase subunit 6/NADH:ubiquinone oxidoreductase subunit I
MNELRKRAKELLDNKTVKYVIGYEEGTAGNVRPALISDPVRTDKLIYDERCVHNLALYLTKTEIRKAGKVAIVAPLHIMKSIIILASENQITENNLLVLGIAADGTFFYFDNFEAMETYVNKNPQVYKPEDKTLLDSINAMSRQEQWDFWQNELSRCFKCYACRGACPMCYCSKCTVDCNQPQWISVPSHDLGNLEWHTMRAMHLAGRCVNCGQCAEACPLDIPVNILTLKLSDQIAKDFNYFAGTSLKQEYVLSSFKPNDKENFIG